MPAAIPARRSRNGRFVHALMFAVLGTALGSIALPAPAAETVWLSSLDVSKTVQGWGQPQVDRSVTGKPLSIAGQQFARGLGTHAISTLAIELGGGTERLTALVGVDDDARVNAASVVFRVVGDGRTLWKSGVMKLGQAPQRVDVKLKGVQSLTLGGGRCAGRHQLRPRRLGQRQVRSDRRAAADHRRPPARARRGGHPHPQAAGHAADQRGPGFRRAAGPSVSVYHSGHGSAADGVCRR